MMHMAIRSLFVFGILALVMLSLSGCGQQAAPVNQTQESAQAPAQQQAGAAPSGTGGAVPSGQEGLIAQWKTYSQPTFSFDYPAMLSAEESLGSYMNGSGYAVVALQDESTDDPALLVAYIRYGNMTSSVSSMGATEIASGFLESDNTGEDTMGLLHLSTNKSGISSFTTAGGYGAADMTFQLEGDNGQVLSGYAIQVYDPATTVGMKARVLAVDPEKAKETRDRFLSSLKLS